jgi:hypothetical protein
VIGREGPETAKPPVALGCFFAVSVVVALIGLVSFAVVFLESGADTGEIELDSAESYAPGTAAFVSEHNFYLVRLPDGSFVALDDFDERNRQSQGSRCRVSPSPIEDAKDANQLRAALSPEAAGSTVVLRETCFGGVYDIAGITLAGDGRNLDRFATDVNRRGRVVVDRSERTCSVRDGGNWAVPLAC